MALRTIGVKLTADISQYTSALARAGAATKDFQGKLDQAAKGGKLDKVADSAGIAGIGLLGLAAGAVKMRMDFDKSMSAVQAATHAGASDIDKLRQAALQAGKDTQYSATQAANGVTELAKAGVSAADILGGGLKGALNLAAAGQLDVGEAAETAATAMTQFGLSGKDIPHIADLLAAGAGKAQGSVHDMGYALKQSGLVASQFGLSVEDTTGTLAAFASAGLIGSDAGTSFKTMLLSLANPQAKTKDAMDELGISAYNAQGKFVGITNLAQQLHDKLGGLTQAQRDQTLAMIFGTDAIRAANVLYKQGGAGIQDWINKTNTAGYASKTAGDLTNNLSGDIERLKGSIETLAIQSGSGANGGLRVLTKSLDGMVGQFLAMPPAVSGTLTVLAGVGGASLLALAAFVKLRKGLASANAELTAMGPAGEKAALGLSRVTSVAGKIGIWLTVLEVVGEIAKQFDTTSANVDQLTASLTDFVSTGKATGELSDIFGNNLKDLGKNAQAADAASHGFWKGLNDITTLLPGASSLVKTLNDRIFGLSFDTAKDNMTAFDQALTAYMTTTSNARTASELWNRVLTESGLNTEQLAKLLPNAYKEVGQLNTAWDKASQAGHASADGSVAAADGMKQVTGAAGPAVAETQKYTTAAQAAVGAVRGQRAALGALSDFMKAETDPVFGLIKAETDLESAQDNATKAIKEHGKKSKEARAATNELALASIALQGAVGNVAQGFNGKLSPALINTLKHAGVTATEIKILTGEFQGAKKAADQYDGSYAAKTSAPGAKDAKKQLDDAYTAANHFAGPYRATVTVYGASGAELALRRLSIYQQALKSGRIPVGFNGPIKGPDGKYYAEGGWTGPGSKWQPAGVVHADEFVIKKDSRRKIESQAPGLLNAMNTTGKATPPGYASGGQVWPFPTTARGTRIPSRKEVGDAVVPAVPGGGGGPGYKWMEAAVRAAFPGIGIYSDYRPGAITVTGNRSYHGFGRAVDFAPSRALAEWINAHYFAATRELITPWQSLNIQNGRRHTYSAIVEAGHDFAHGNAHDHWAMKSGGVISEPIFGVGASGRTYSFGENYQPERVTPMWQSAGGGGVTNVNLTINAAVGSHPREIGAEVINYLGAYLQGGGELRVNGQKVL